MTVGQLQQLPWPFYAGLSIALGLAIYQQTLIYHYHKPDCFKAFLNNNWFGLAVFAGVFFAYF